MQSLPKMEEFRLFFCILIKLFRFCQFFLWQRYNKNDFFLGSEAKMNQLQEHVIYFNNDIYINNLLKKQLKEDVIISINYCLQKINSDIDNKPKIENSWK